MPSGYSPIQAVISFRAPSPEDKPVDREKYGRGNFIWRFYRLWFQKEQKGDDKFYVYQTELNSNGTELRPGKPIVVESDSKGSFDPDMETDDVKTSGVKKLFPRLFKSKGPDLFPDEAVTYVNIDENNKKYDKQDFLNNFLDESYIVVDKTSTLKNIKGEPVGVDIPPEKSPLVETKSAYRRYVQAAKEKAFSGGFDIMQKFQKKELKKQKQDKVIDRSKQAGQNDPKHFSGGDDIMKEWKSQGTGPKVDKEPAIGGFSIVRKWQLQHGAKPETKPSEFQDGFDIMRKWQRSHRKVGS